MLHIYWNVQLNFKCLFTVKMWPSINPVFISIHFPLSKWCYYYYFTVLFSAIIWPEVVEIDVCWGQMQTVVAVFVRMYTETLSLLQKGWFENILWAGVAM